MKTKIFIQSTLILFSVLSTAACVAPIGKEEFTCNNLEKGGVCAGPRDVYEMTNDRESLEDMTQEELERALNKKNNNTAHQSSGNNTSDVDVYEPRDNKQQTVNNYQSAKPLPQLRSESVERDGFNSWPSSTEPLAPEPLAVISQPKVMRILVTAWKDDLGNLNMPGYTYVQVQDKDWLFGEAANLRPTRVVPLETRKQTQEELRKAKERSKGVSPLGVLNSDVE